MPTKRSSGVSRRNRPVREDRVREKRIMMEIVVDAYGAEERAMGWLVYLENSLKVPFKATCRQ